MSSKLMHGARVEPAERVGAVPASAVPAAAVREGAGRRGAVVLSVVTTVLLLGASVAGVLVDGFYREPGSAVAMFRAYDLVALVVVVPGLVVALIGVRRGWVVAEAVWVGLLAATVYSEALVVFGTSFADGFLAHVAVLAAAVFALITALGSMDVAGITRRMPSRGRARVVSVILGLLAVGLGGMWVVVSLQFAWSGTVPAGSALIETDSLVHLGIALDLVLLVPTYGAAAVLLWRRRPWGYLLAAVALVSGIVHQLGYLVAMPFQVQAGVPGAVAADPAEPIIVALFLVAAALLFAPQKGGSSSCATTE